MEALKIQTARNDTSLSHTHFKKIILMHLYLLRYCTNTTLTTTTQHKFFCPQKKIGGFQEIELENEPTAIRIRVGGSKMNPYNWHGMPLDDLHTLIPNMTEEDQVISIPRSKNKEYIKLRSHYTAQQNIAGSVLVYLHKIQPAFALTDFKLQGRTLSKLIINICTRSVPPWMDLTAFYVLISRVRRSKALRVLKIDHSAKSKIMKLKHNVILHAWENGYDENGNWVDRKAINSLVQIQKQRAKAEHDEKEYLKNIATIYIDKNASKKNPTNKERQKKTQPLNHTMLTPLPPTSSSIFNSPKLSQGSPKKKQRKHAPSADKRKCGVCQQTGHQRNTCPELAKANNKNNA